MSHRKIKASAGQALVEYILLFAIISIITVNMLKTITTYFDEAVGNFGNIFSRHLATGVCERNCFFNDFGNK
ncbi:MAG: hypothetical protein A2504_10735 [Bdellovibrionales bacterium RIFOXYD12_FULL_39_22]|nr:MAG: hypothetical protein A2385_14370 [Bdellovibrionales bacterium RIFOXYB1_FULL_39_21]OFZ40418.1 MAG: hypothetical protein A2485_03060 [Bdellovibrionales bacterium RIFOXYC12_FULL_39_17]OFZ49667.1 MAG: hypothetical protein A2404_09520 [Bdellovibrionales bacterium RIFOXYC1_FULL_39_130]OFZ73181.1 MAG: hypothetical protein A2451_16815 [Bdellovibrionales bacterium RIFOXYC2_FULL_39_8]OFZ77337.1 MAG: hypothetical protein A2560_06185 [Bdellovibrionales bacterium RIFOXYD1_FULL_39_84]OFZ95992.1 MAG: